MVGLPLQYKLPLLTRSQSRTIVELNRVLFPRRYVQARSLGGEFAR